MLQPEFSGFRSFLPITDDTFLRNGDADIRIGVSSCCCSSTRHNWHTPATGLNTSTIPIMDMNGTGFVFGASVQLTPVSVLPVHKGSIQSGSGGALLNNPYGVFVSGHYAYVTSSGSSALEIVNISNPASPTHAGSIVDGSGGALLNSPYGVFVSGNYAYVKNYDSSALEIVDVTDPLIPVHSGNLTDGGGSIPCLSLPTGLYVAGNYAYVASHGSDALEIVNVTNPANPVHAARLDDGSGVAPFLDNPLSLFISGNYAYVASSQDDRFEIVDVTNPENPVHKGSIQDGDNGAFLNNPFCLFVSEKYAYIPVKNSNALEIIDVGTITAANVNVVSSTHITCTVNLTGAVPTLYNVVVTSPDGSFGTLPGGFTVTGATPTTPTPTPTPTPVPTSTTITILPTHTPARTPAPYDNSGPDSDPTPVPTDGQRTTVMVNVGGYSSVYRANVTGTGISDLIITGSASSGPGTDLPPARGTVLEYIDLLPARYASIQESVISASLPRLLLNDHNLAPQDVVIYHLSDSTWNALPTTALSVGFGRFAITGNLRESAVRPVMEQATPQGTFSDIVKAH